jgi:hypothetical protein
VYEWPTPDAVVNLVATLVATLVGAWLGYLLAGRQLRRRERRVHVALRRALRAEVEHCAKLANTYLSAGVLSPAHRLPSVIYDTTFGTVVGSGTLPAHAVTALLEFYSHVRQVNWCLDQLDDRLPDASSLDAEQERDRLWVKLEEMKAPSSRLYDRATAALPAE